MLVVIRSKLLVFTAGSQNCRRAGKFSPTPLCLSWCISCKTRSIGIRKIDLLMKGRMNRVGISLKMKRMIAPLRLVDILHCVYRMEHPNTKCTPFTRQERFMCVKFRSLPFKKKIKTSKLECSHVLAFERIVKE